MRSMSMLRLAIVSQTHTRQRCHILNSITDNIKSSFSNRHHRRAIQLFVTKSSLPSSLYPDAFSGDSTTARADASYYNEANRIHGGIPIGAVQIAASRVQNFREIVNSTLGTTKNRGVEKFVGPCINDNGDRAGIGGSSSSSCILLIHVAPAVAAALDDGHPGLTEFLRRNDGVYIPGLRRSRTHRQAMRRRRSAILPKFNRTDRTATASNTNDGTIITRQPDTRQQAFSFSELFAGIGGFRLGLEAIGGTCVMANEFDPYAASIYRHHFGGSNDYDSSKNDCHLIEADILDLCAKFDIPADTDILTAGFPCQPFSYRGKQLGLHDSRGQLYRELVRVLRGSNPKSFIFENVAGLVTLGGGNAKRKEAGPTFRTILEAFEECGYDVSWKICNSRHYVAQRRERVFIVGMRKDLNIERAFSWKWYDQMMLLAEGESSSYNNSADGRSIFSVRDIMEPPDSLAVLESELSPQQWTKLQQVHSRKQGGAATYASIDIDAGAPTLISSYRRSGSYTSKFIFTERDGTEREIPRFLTPRECCRLQGFPEDYDIPSTVGRDGGKSTSHFYAGIGNAVVPPVVRSIGKEIVACLRS